LWTDGGDEGKKDDVLVGTDTGGLKRFGGELLIFIRNHVDAERKFIDVGALAAEVEDADFGVGNTAVEAGFGVRLLRYSCQYVSRLSRLNKGYRAQGLRRRIKPEAGFRAAAIWSEGEYRPCSCSSGSISLDGVPSLMISLVVILLLRRLKRYLKPGYRALWSYSDFQAKKRHQR